MSPTERLALYRHVFTVNGPYVQIFKACEEAGEYIRALTRFFAKEGTREQLIGELADLQITSEQMALLASITPEEVQAEVERKLERLSRRTDFGSGPK